MSHETTSIFKIPLRFNMTELAHASDSKEIPVQVNEGKGFRETRCNAGHVRACLRTYGFRTLAAS